ncbi:MAG: ABC transporter ATP-binding protein [Nitrospirae bacterium]|nr:ABC transporter ATP-binding protein [Nitrospirota bacterium]
MILVDISNITSILGGFSLNVNSFKLSSGELVAVAGNNGSGKSTFLGVLSGLNKFRGRYLLNDEEFVSLKRHEISKKIGILPQSTTLNMPFDVFYVVLTGRFAHSNGRSYSSLDIEKTITLMNEFDIYHLKDRQFNELSGGEKQRVLLCRVINMDTDILLLDEPFSGVDMLHQAGLIKILKVLKDKQAIVVVIHDLSFAINHFDRFIFFKSQDNSNKNASLLYDLSSDTLSNNKMRDVFGIDIELLDHNNKKFVFLRD